MKAELQKSLSISNSPSEVIEIYQFFYLIKASAYEHDPAWNVQFDDFELDLYTKLFSDLSALCSDFTKSCLEIKSIEHAINFYKFYMLLANVATHLNYNWTYYFNEFELKLAELLFKNPDQLNNYFEGFLIKENSDIELFSVYEDFLSLKAIAISLNYGYDFQNNLQTLENKYVATLTANIDKLIQNLQLCIERVYSYASLRFCKHLFTIVQDADIDLDTLNDLTSKITKSSFIYDLEGLKNQLTDIIENLAVERIENYYNYYCSFKQCAYELNFDWNHHFRDLDLQLFKFIFDNFTSIKEQLFQKVKNTSSLKKILRIVYFLDTLKIHALELGISEANLFKQALDDLSRDLIPRLPSLKSSFEETVKCDLNQIGITTFLKLVITLKGTVNKQNFDWESNFKESELILLKKELINFHALQTKTTDKEATQNSFAKFKPAALEVVKAFENKNSKLDLSKLDFEMAPLSIGLLNYLKTLEITHTQLRQLPDSINGLVNLDTLHISNTKLQSLPKAIGKLSNLMTLKILRNEITELPETVGKLAKLQTLIVSHNLLKSLPKSIGQLKSLTTLDVNRNNLTTLPDVFDSLKSLTDCDVSNNKLNNLPASIGKVTLLKNLDISSNFINSLNRIDFKELRHLKVLFVSNNQFEELPSSILKAVNLTHLAVDKGITLPGDLARFITVIYKPKNVIAT